MPATVPGASFALDQLPWARRYVRARAREACGGSKGRGKLDPFYVTVTQGRDSRANWTRYSSCGDLLHWLAWDLGVREEWVNRDDPATGRKWTFGTAANGGRDNISTLQGRKGHPGPAIATPVTYLPEAGDFALCWNFVQRGPIVVADGVHVRVFGDTVDGVVETFDYGAGGMSPSEFPGATCNTSRIVVDHGRLLLKSLRTGATKRVQRVVPLATIMALTGDRWPSMTDEDTADVLARVA